jgi:endoglucanase
MLYGVNLSGAEFGRGNTYAKDYIYPSLSHLQYYASKGVEFVRLPFRWERIQPELNGELNQAELTRIQKFLSNAESTGIKVILDVHNYAGYNNVKIGNGDVTIESFENLWGKLASALKDYSAVAGYGLMNEPTGITAQTWIDAAQSAINAIRAVDIDTAIYVCGTSWSGAHSWLKYNSGLNTLFDPAKNLIFEAHQYFDKDSSGDYSMSYDDEKATPMTGVDRLQPFLTWLQDNDLKGFIGEYSIPDNDPRWQVVMENFLAELADHNVPSAYWGGGPWWGTYPMSIEPDKNCS